ncbi:MAG: sensor histidine kinase [Segetibacter sp.]|nr:sensor histidine kinase [Segetibacter sp.]
MNNWLQANKKLLFIVMTLQARLDIRDFFLKNAVREIYENIGQVLSLVRMQLAMLDSNNKEDNDGSLNSSGNLVGQSIRDLRAMSRSFYPDTDILKEDGLTQGFENTIGILYKKDNGAVKIKGIRKEVQPELKLVTFKMVQEILIAIKEIEGDFISLSISYIKEAVKFTISYNGVSIELNGENESNFTNRSLTLQERAELIEARFQVSRNKTGITQIKLISPLNFAYND